MEWTERIMALAGLASGLVLSWLAYRRQGVTTGIENLAKAYETLSRDYERQAVEIKNLRAQLEREQLRSTTFQEHLDIARGIIEKHQRRIEALEAEVKRLKHLETNV